MNFLAHLYLADPTPASRIGNLLPDLCRIRPGTPLHPDVAAGVANHRRVDAFTDTHPLFARSKARLFPGCGRFSGIVVDIFYDHFLTLAWDAHCSAPLPDFVAQVHRDFRDHPRLMPPAVQPILVRLADQHWLLSYGDADGLRLCFRRMSVRFSERFGREVRLEQAVDLLAEHGDGLRRDFEAFFPQLVRHIHSGAMASPPPAC